MSACVQELSENMGLIKLNQRLQDPQLAEWFAGIFPRDTPKNMRFSINFFTSIGLGGLTDALREHLAALPKLLAEQRAAQAAAQQSAPLPLNCTQISMRWLSTANSLPKGSVRNVSSISEGM
jgi:pre-mRNA-splicing factor CWC22